MPAVVAFRCSNASLATFPPLLQDSTLQGNLAQFTAANFFSLAFPGGTPPGGYLFFLALVVPNTLDDNVLNTGDVLASSSVSFVVQ